MTRFFIAISVFLFTWIFYPDNSLPTYKKTTNPIINKINENNSKIQTMTCNVKLRVIQNHTGYNLTGTLYLEKPNNFRMVLKSFRGTELDIGSNDTNFWFWSRNMSPPALYYARHGHTTRLRDPFNPVWIMNSFGIESINSSLSITETNSKIYASERVKNNQLIRSCVIEKSTKDIVAYYLFNKDNQFVVITEIEKKKGLPNTIHTIWQEENVNLLFNFENIKINNSINENAFKMPTNKEKISIEQD